MELIPHIRKPFTVEAVEITDENIAEIAELVGSLEIDDEEVKFILIDRKKVPAIHKAYVGWWLTDKDGTYRVYSPTIFNEQFVEREPGTGYFFDEGEPEEPPVLVDTEPVVTNVFTAAEVEPVRVIKDTYTGE